MFTTLGWLGKSITASVVIIPFILLTSSFGRVFKTQPESMMFYWMLGTAMGIAIYLTSQGKSYLLMPDTQLTILGIIGLTLGAMANILLIQAIVASPNPGIPVTIVGANSAIIFIIGPALAIFLPAYFQHIKFDAIHLTGILLTLVGVGIISIHR